MRNYYFFGTLLILFSAFTTHAQLVPRLVWAEEFDYTGVPSADNWSYDTGGHGWGNNELQHYTSSPENAYVQDGQLTITAMKRDGNWTSARLVTKNKHDFKYGRVEVRAMLPLGKGTWPAIWMLPTDWKYGGWPESGEIDIMEHVGFDAGVVHGTVHTKAYHHTIGTQVGDTVRVKDCGENFHIYAIEWDAEKIDFFVDEQKYFSFTNDGRGDFAT